MSEKHTHEVPDKFEPQERGPGVDYRHGNGDVPTNVIRDQTGRVLNIPPDQRGGSNGEESDEVAPPEKALSAVTRVPSREPLTVEGLQTLLLKRVREKRLVDILREGVCCVDGRNPEAIAGTPGGDAGILLGAIATVEEMRAPWYQRMIGRPKPLSYAEVREIVFRLPGTLYLHTAEHALQSHGEHKGVLERIQKDPVFAPFVSDGEMDAKRLIMYGTGNSEANERLLDLLTESECQGCGHLQHAMNDPKAYGVRPDLARQIVCASIERMWDNSHHKTHLDILPGDHGERALVQVELEEDLTNDSIVPLFQANNEEGGQVFVSHPNVMKARLGQVASIIEGMFGIDRARFMQRAIKKIEMQTTETVKRLASGKRILALVVNTNGDMVIADRGIVHAYEPRPPNGFP